MNIWFLVPLLPFILCSPPSFGPCPDPCRQHHPGFLAKWLPIGYRHPEGGRWQERHSNSLFPCPSPALCFWDGSVHSHGAHGVAPPPCANSSWAPHTLLSPLTPLGLRLITASYTASSRMSPHPCWFLQPCPHLSKPFIFVSSGRYNKLPYIGWLN